MSNVIKVQDYLIKKDPEKYKKIFKGIEKGKKGVSSKEMKMLVKEINELDKENNELMKEIDQEKDKNIGLATLLEVTQKEVAQLQRGASDAP